MCLILSKAPRMAQKPVGLPYYDSPTNGRFPTEE